jgi:peptidoglycan hydrolase CwlO-like protein
MNIEQRLEALTQSLELVASLQKENERRIGIMAERHNELVTAMTRLAMTASDHEERIRELERR